MSSDRRFERADLQALHDAHGIRIRCGEDHRYTEVWVVVVEERAFIRSWNLEPSGWFRSFEKEPEGSLELAGREIAIRGVVTRDEHLLRGVTEAYADKYSAPESEHWVVGLAEPWRVRATLQLVPRQSS